MDAADLPGVAFWSGRGRSFHAVLRPCWGGIVVAVSVLFVVAVCVFAAVGYGLEWVCSRLGSQVEVGRAVLGVCWPGLE